MRNIFISILDQAQAYAGQEPKRAVVPDLPASFFKLIFDIVQNKDAPFVMQKGVGSTGQPVFEFDVQQYAVMMRHEWKAVIMSAISSRDLSKQQLINLYRNIKTYASYLINQLECFSQRSFGPFYNLQPSIFDSIDSYFASRYPDYRRWQLKKQTPAQFDLSLIVLNTAQAFTMRVTEFMGYMLEAIEDVIDNKVLIKSYLNSNKINMNGFRDFIADRLDSVVEQHEQFLPKPVTELRHAPVEKPWRGSLIHHLESQAKLPSITPVSKNILSFKEKWQLLSSRQKWTMAGILLFEVAVVVALAITIPGSEVVTMPAASAIAANVLASMLGSVVLACTTAGCAYRVFKQQNPPKEQDGAASQVMTSVV